MSAAAAQQRPTAVRNATGAGRGGAAAPVVAAVGDVGEARVGGEQQLAREAARALVLAACGATAVRC